MQGRRRKYTALYTRFQGKKYRRFPRRAARTLEGMKMVRKQRGKLAGLNPGAFGQSAEQKIRNAN